MKKSRKKYPSDRDVMTLRISSELHSKVKDAAIRDKRTIEAFIDIALNAALTPKF